MPGKKEWCVRVVQTMDDSGKECNEGDKLSDAFLDCLRYAGLIRVHDNAATLGGAIRCFDLLTWDVIEDGGKVWAEMNAKRMQSFGFNAVATPREDVY